MNKIMRQTLMRLLQIATTPEEVIANCEKQYEYYRNRKFD